MKLIYVDMHGRAVREASPQGYARFGGRALIAHLLLAEVPAACDPLGPHNKLIFAPGLLAGSGVATAGRLSAGAKSPLTGGVKEANAGGTAGDTLGKMGIQALVIEGQAPAGDLWLLHVGAEAATLLPADELRGLGTYDTIARLQQRFGETASVLCIGPAGEQTLTGAGIASSGLGDQKSNHAARGGLGAVMGSKGLKAIVISGEGARSRKPEISELFRASSKRFAETLINDPKTGVKGSSHLYGTASIVAAVNEMGSMPTRNFSAGSFEAAGDLTGEHIR
ncbi:MAG TPA: aldehyde ferredoxin oxidoreductase N-terminal domain-containing protein, partial [Anaerolineae bacterium]